MSHNDVAYGEDADREDPWDIAAQELTPGKSLARIVANARFTVATVTVVGAVLTALGLITVQAVVADHIARVFAVFSIGATLLAVLLALLYLALPGPQGESRKPRAGRVVVPERVASDVARCRSELATDCRRCARWLRWPSHRADEPGSASTAARSPDRGHGRRAHRDDIGDPVEPTRRHGRRPAPHRRGHRW